MKMQLPHRNELEQRGCVLYTYYIYQTAPNLTLTINRKLSIAMAVSQHKMTTPAPALNVFQPASRSLSSGASFPVWTVTRNCPAVNGEAGGRHQVGTTTQRTLEDNFRR